MSPSSAFEDANNSLLRLAVTYCFHFLLNSAAYAP